MDSKLQRSMLIINPNTSRIMSEGLRPLVDLLGFDTTRVEYFTAPDGGVSSINNEEDAAKSSEACLPVLKTQMAYYDAFLVCCYSNHPLVSQLRKALTEEGLSSKPVTGIFEASIATCLQAIGIDQKFGIVSTGSQWEDILGEAVAATIGANFSKRYAGCQTTGLNADELHSTPEAEVALRMKHATKRLLQNGAKAITLGCAGMAGMNETVREACVEELGEQDGHGVKIIDGVVAGVVYLEGALRSGL